MMARYLSEHPNVLEAVIAADFYGPLPDAKARSSEVAEVVRQADGFEQVLDLMDADSNGAVTLDEMTAASEARAQRRSERKAERFSAIDTNSDGNVSIEEFAAHGQQMFFTRADTNSNGEVTKQEADAFREAMRTTSAPFS